MQSAKASTAWVIRSPMTRRSCSGTSITAVRPHPCRCTSRRRASSETAKQRTTTEKSPKSYVRPKAAISVGSDGNVTGVFSNGQRRVLAQVAVADFASVEGLDRAGQNLWIATDDSGQPLIGAAESGGRGSIVAGALEQSNVDLGQEFVDLIAFQRGFQANSRVISTADEMYAELVNLKR